MKRGIGEKQKGGLSFASLIGHINVTLMFSIDSFLVVHSSGPLRSDQCEINSCDLARSWVFCVTIDS
jgi:hypothetical protein